MRHDSGSHHLADKVAVVTGVTSGVGHALAMELARRGALVVGAGRREAEGAALVDAVRNEGGEARFVAADVSLEVDCARIADAAVEAYGRIDIVVNNAGSAGSSPVCDVVDAEPADFDAVVAVNLRGPFLLSRAAWPHLCVRGGVLLHVASINAVQALGGMAAYNAAKAGLVQLSATLAVEGATCGVRSNVIVLGGVPSEMNSALKVALGRQLRGDDWEPTGDGAAVMTADQLVRAVALLCDDDAAAITGAMIAIDGAASAGLLSSSMIRLVAAELVPLG